MQEPNRARPMGLDLPVGADAASVRRRIEAMEKLLENSFTVPGVNYRIGLAIWPRRAALARAAAHPELDG